MHSHRPIPGNFRAIKFASFLLVAAIAAGCGGAIESEMKAPVSVATAAPIAKSLTVPSNTTPPPPPPAVSLPTTPPVAVLPSSPVVPTTSVPVTINNGKLKIFILAGQSNMVGFGKTDRGGDPDRATIQCPLRADGTRGYPSNILGGMGSLRAMVNANPSKYSYLVDPAKTISYKVDADYYGCVKADTKTYSGWAKRDNVYVVSLDVQPLNSDTVTRSGKLTVGFGSGTNRDLEIGEGYIGPEFGFGHAVGSGLEDKVLLIKTSWGGKSLAVDFRPPSSVGLGVGFPSTTSAETPDVTGAYYIEMVRKVKLVLSDIKKYYPDYDGNGYEVIGLGWHQGWNDRVNYKLGYVAQYETNMVNLIQDLRKDLNLPNLLVTIGNAGLADADKDINGLNLINAQGNVSDPIKYPKFAGNVTTVDTRPFHYPNTSPEIGFIHHWNYSGESYFKVGESMGVAMLKLMRS